MLAAGTQAVVMWAGFAGVAAMAAVTVVYAAGAWITGLLRAGDLAALRRIAGGGAPER
jgi:hypothetical protein